MSRAECRALVERRNPVLAVSRQCRLLSVSRSSIYRLPAEISDDLRRECPSNRRKNLAKVIGMTFTADLCASELPHIARICCGGLLIGLQCRSYGAGE
jgi:hypothetical protein